MPMYHHADVEPSAIHPAAFVGAVDPAGTPANNVTAHKLWIDTTGSTFVIKKRNAGNTAWDIVSSLKHTDLTALTTGDPHTQYLLKSLGTTKGDVLVYNGSAWIRVGAGTDGFLLTADSAAGSGLSWQSAAALAGAHIISDNGTPMAQEPTLEFVGFTVADVPGPPGKTRVTANFINPMTTPGDLIVGTTAGAAARLAKGADGYMLRVDPTTHLLAWVAPPAGTGTVTSVAQTVPSEFAVAGSPVSTSGTLAITKANQNANLVWAGPTSGGAAAPTFRSLVAADVPINLKRMSIAFQLGDGTNAIVAASEREQWVELNFDATIEGWELSADAAGSIVIDVWKDTYANYPPTVADTIAASAKPTLSAAAKNRDVTLTGWTTAITRGDTIKIHVDSSSTVKAATLTLYLVKT